MSRFYTGDNNNLETLKVDFNNVKQTQTFNEKLAEQKKEIVFLTQYDDYIKNFINNGINKYNYLEQQAKSEYRKDVSMLKTEYNTFKNTYLNIFKNGNEYEYENSFVPALLYSTLGFQGSKILLQNRVILRNVVAVYSFIKIFEYNAPHTYDRFKLLYNEKIQIGKDEYNQLKTNVDKIDEQLHKHKNMVMNDVQQSLLDYVHDARLSLYKVLYTKQ
ncbi:uncharacterized protein HGUI_03283 [Hanseniaspora guilliermondii]|uniref:Uncharacterized protein n=1 Tax=Hanseniaspora guilliermondii TaxID=56406 RepID=A0A1L0B7L5_9ASCO|nr:uncharacterized protein HGUI_03283 [Hanseniaspora guilliermondii]